MNFLAKTNMKYLSTRDTQKTPLTVSSADAIKRGLAPDRGLFMPESIPALTESDFSALLGMRYEERAADILSRFLTDYDKELLLSDCTAAYAEDRFPGGAAHRFRSAPPPKGSPPQALLLRRNVPV